MMLHKTTFIRKSTLSSKTTIIKLGENLEFTVTRNEGSWRGDYYQVENIKGSLEITKITVNTNGCTQAMAIDYAFLCKTFPVYDFCNAIYTFHISANIQMKQCHAETQSIWILAARLKLLKPFEFYKGSMYLYDCHVRLTYYVKKIEKNEISGNDIEVHIENPYDIDIEGQKGDYKSEHSSQKDLTLTLTFSYDTSVKYRRFYSHLTYKSKLSDSQQKSAQTDAIETKRTTISVEDRPKLSLSPSSQSSIYETSKWYKIMSNNRFADVFLISSDAVKVPSHRSLLAESSTVFSKIFESHETPVIIDVEDFDAETIQAILQFLYGKNDAIKGKEMIAFKFAVKYRIQELIDACCSFFEKAVAPTNVCEFIQIAYSYNFDELKQKCLNMLVQKKKEIDSIQFANLPKNILSDFFNAF